MRLRLFHCLLATTALLFASCNPTGLDQDETPEETAYTIDFQLDAESLLGLDGADVTTDIRICEYNDKNERINIQDIRNIKNGDKPTLKANKLAVKLTICLYVFVTYKNQNFEETAWFAQVFYLEPESNTIIKLDGYTALGKSDPLK